MRLRTQTGLAALLRHARFLLADAGIAEAALDARLLVEHFSGTTRTDAIAEPGRQIDAGAVAALEDALKRRLSGEPVHRILGFREFYGLRLALSAGTLEPRPDTETLVDAVLPSVRETVARQGRCRILDLGAGTGAIGLALLCAVPQALATGVDLSDDALATAWRNAESLGLAGRFTTAKSDWYAGISGRFDAIVSNPPYILGADIASLAREVRDFDPLVALDGGEDGLAAYRAIARGAEAHLEKGGFVAVEIGEGQARCVAEIFRDFGFAQTAVRSDLGGHERAILFKPLMNDAR